MLRFQVDGMTCGHCVQSVTGAVKTADPKAQVAVDLPSKQVTVDTTEPAEVIATAIRQAGYEPSIT